MTTGQRRWRPTRKQRRRRCLYSRRFLAPPGATAPARGAGASIPGDSSRHWGGRLRREEPVPLFPAIPRAGGVARMSDTITPQQDPPFFDLLNRFVAEL